MVRVFIKRNNMTQGFAGGLLGMSPSRFSQKLKKEMSLGEKFKMIRLIKEKMIENGIEILSDL